MFRSEGRRRRKGGERVGLVGGGKSADDARAIIFEL